MVCRRSCSMGIWFWVVYTPDSIHRFVFRTDRSTCIGILGCYSFHSAWDTGTGRFHTVGNTDSSHWYDCKLDTDTGMGWFCMSHSSLHTGLGVFHRFHSNCSFLFFCDIENNIDSLWTVGHNFGSRYTFLLLLESRPLCTWHRRDPLQDNYSSSLSSGTLGIC